MSSPTPEPPVASSPSPVPSALASDSPYAQAVSFPFADINAAFDKPSVPEQRALIATALAFKDGTGVCKEAIVIDILFKALKFSHNAGLNRTQTRIFYEIFRSLLEHIKADPAPSREQSFEAFRRQLVSYTRDPSAVSPSPQPIPQSSSVAGDMKIVAVASDSWDPDADAIKIEEERKKAAEEKARQEQEEREKDPKKAKAKAAPPKKDDKKKDKGKGDSDSQSAAASAAASPEPRPLPQVFTVPIAKEIADYVSETVFAHYLLFQAVLHPTFFVPFKVVQREEVYLQTPLWQLEQYPLEAAEKYEEQLRADEEARLKKEQEEKEQALKAEEEARAATAAAEKAAAEEAERIAKDPVAQLVNQHLARIQAQLDEQLKAHAQQLDARIAALERRGR